MRSNDSLPAEFEEGKELIISVVASMGEEHALGYKEAPKN
jgi:translation initiation factor 5A